MSCASAALQPCSVWLESFFLSAPNQPPGPFSRLFHELPRASPRLLRDETPSPSTLSLHALSQGGPLLLVHGGAQRPFHDPHLRSHGGFPFQIPPRTPSQSKTAQHPHSPHRTHLDGPAHGVARRHLLLVREHLLQHGPCPRWRARPQCHWQTVDVE